MLQGSTLVAGLGAVEDAQVGGRRPFRRTYVHGSERTAPPSRGRACHHLLDRFEQIG